MKTSAAVGLLLLGLSQGACTGNQSVFTLEVGTCFDDVAGDGQIASVPVVDCAEPHDNEVFAVFDYTGGDTYPGEETMDTTAFNLCLEPFEGYVGMTYAQSTLEIFPIYPTADSWAAGDREIICSLYDINLAKLTGSMRGSAR